MYYCDINLIQDLINRLFLDHTQLIFSLKDKTTYLFFFSLWYELYVLSWFNGDYSQLCSLKHFTCDFHAHRTTRITEISLGRDSHHTTTTTRISVHFDMQIRPALRKSNPSAQPGVSYRDSGYHAKIPARGILHAYYSRKMIHKSVVTTWTRADFNEDELTHSVVVYEELSYFWYCSV